MTLSRQQQLGIINKECLTSVGVINILLPLRTTVEPKIPTHHLPSKLSTNVDEDLWIPWVKGVDRLVKAIREELYWCLYNSSLLAVRLGHPGLVVVGLSVIG